MVQIALRLHWTFALLSWLRPAIPEAKIFFPRTNDVKANLNFQILPLMLLYSPTISPTFADIGGWKKVSRLVGSEIQHKRASRPTAYGDLNLIHLGNNNSNIESFDHLHHT